MNWIIENKEWFFSGAGASLIGAFLIFFRKKTKHENATNNTNNNTNTINNYVNLSIPSPNNTNNAKSCKSIQILFVDDQKFDIVEVLKKAGWVNTKRIKDVTNVDSIDVKNADVIFVDVNGVGCQLFPKDQGLGLAEAIKKKYPKKYIVLYSAVSHNFHKALNVVDNILEKNADPYEFINILDNYINNEDSNKGRE